MAKGGMRPKLRDLDLVFLFT